MARNWINRGKSPDQPKRGRTLRNLAIVAAMATLSTGGAVVFAGSAHSDVVSKVTICHRTNSNSNPYVEITPNVSGVLDGHAKKHQGPVWNPTLKKQHIKWGDIIPAFDYDLGQGTQHFDGQNVDTPEGAQILANGCEIPNTVSPEDPTVTQSVCNSDHNPTVPDVTLPTTAGITYSIAPAPAAGGDSVVTATANAPGNWFQAPAPAGWTFVDITHETFAIHFDAAPNCKTTVVPADPTVTQSVCAGDPASPTVPTVDLAITDGITYSIAPDPAAGGVSVVTATADSGAGDQFVAPAPAGWVFVDSTHETFTINFDDAPDCTVPPTVVAPADPGVTEASCSGSPAVVVAPTLTLATTAGVAYTASASAPYAGGQSVTVTATADGTHVFEAPAPAGWTFVDAQHETFGVTFDKAPTCGGTGPLANTGAKSGQLLEIGGIVLLFGLGMQFLGLGLRRRPTN